MTKKIIIAGRPGQLGNSLVLYSGFLALGREHGLKIDNPSFFRYAHYFSFSKEHPSSSAQFSFVFYFARIVYKLKLSNRWFGVLSIDWEESVDLDRWMEENRQRSKNLLVQGWQFRGHQLLQKHRQFLVHAFAPAKPYLEDLDRYFLAIKTQTVIGIHIRRGDYVSFEGGRYFYELNDYVKLALSMQALFSAKDIRFLVFSNEEVNVKLFSDAGLEALPGPGSEILDLYALARCNYIIGPPSTFTMWASFYGKVPLLMVRDVNANFTLQDFVIQQHF